MTPAQLLAVVSGLSVAPDDGHDVDLGGRATVVATVAEVCPDCGEDYDELGSTARCRGRHQLRLTPAGAQLVYRGRRADAPARSSLTRAKRAGRAGDRDRARALWGSIPTHDWGMFMVNRLAPRACGACGVAILTGDEDDRIAGRVRAEPWALSNDGVVAAILLERPLWRLWGAWPSYRAAEHRPGQWGSPGPSAGAPGASAAITVVAAHVCGTRLAGEPLQMAVAHVRPADDIPF